MARSMTSSSVAIPHGCRFSLVKCRDWGCEKRAICRPGKWRAHPGKTHGVICSAKREEPILLRVAVSGVTELLRVFKQDSSPSLPVTVDDSTPIEDVVETLRSDYARFYFLTGDFTDALYTEDCYFADPTVGFSGRDLYRRNLKLLVPFFEDPSLILDSIKQGVDGELKFVEAFWRLRVYLKLPWRPFIAVDGSTRYQLDNGDKIVEHVESWNVTGIEAIGQLFKPSERAIWRKPCRKVGE